MSERTVFHIWMDRIGLLIIAFVLIMIPLLPIDLSPQSWARPDLLFIVLYAAVLRRHRLAPYWLLGLVLLASDFLRMEPIGLWAAIALIALEVVRSNRQAILENLFLGEVLWCAVIFLSALLIEWIVQAIFVIPRSSLGNLMTTWGLTVIVYPFFVGILHLFFGLYRDRSQLANTDEAYL